MKKAPSRSGLQESPLAPVGWSTANPPRWALSDVSSRRDGPAVSTGRKSEQACGRFFLFGVQQEGSR